MSTKNTKTFNREKTVKLVMLGLFTAIVIVLQYLGAFIKFGTFSISLVLMPIVIGSALLGVYSGGFLGVVFGLVVLLSGDAAPFLAINTVAAVFVVIFKGLLAGLAAGAVYRILSKKSKTFAVIASAAVCPIVNTGVFIAGVYLFFLPTISEWGASAGYTNATAYIFLGMIGVNFLLELGINLIFSPAIVRLIQYGQKMRVK